MSDKLITYPVDKLLRWILNEEKSCRIFGIANELFFTPAESDPFRMRRYDCTLETPIGVAAGPHTQMAQNIISAWLCGARYIELKTVQVLDHIEVSKPCIDMEDEGYNCEWSQELTVDESFNQYLDAWILIHVLRHHFGWDAGEPGVIFNISVGYDMQGILSEKIQRFLDRMADCHDEKAEKIKSLAAIYPAIADISIPDRISDNVTLSTMHGCPADEIEQIGRYLIEERGLHTTIKLNPTLLGAEELRRILNEQLHYDVVVPDAAFEHDLEYADALGIIRRLQQSAAAKGVFFGLKLTNTLETVNAHDVLSENEKMVYMSGRALHPISTALAAKLQTDFDGALDISFSAGADCFNTPELIAANLAPVTVCSDLLKPGGYARLRQYLSELSAAMQAVNAASIDEFTIAKNSSNTRDTRSAVLRNLTAYAERARRDEIYSKNFLPFKSIKTPRALQAFNCIHAPCVNTCPAQQAVPEYMFHTARGDDAAAFNVVMETNPFPNVTGMVCDHACQTKCTRQNIDAPLRIRDIKRFISEQQSEPELTPAPPNGLRAAIIGAGPSGLSCAWFLALAGFEVSLYEAKAAPGGMLADAIPRFRLADASLQKDVQRILDLGVKIYDKTRITAHKFQELRSQNDFIYIAVGAQQGKKIGVPGEDSPGVLDALTFLADVRRGRQASLGRRVVVIGGGDSAIDAARTARRLVKKDGEVTLVYRRTRHEMPAGHGEVVEMLHEGVSILELAAPVEVARQNGRLRLLLQKMQLGAPDDSGRKKPFPIPGAQFELVCDAVIVAIGQNVVLDFLPNEIDVRDMRTAWENVFIGGDALHGPATIIAAIADGRKAAYLIKQSARISYQISATKPDKGLSPADYQIKMATRIFPRLPEPPPQQANSFALISQTLPEEVAREEADRCLYCDDVCNVCVSVCPNRANISYTVAPVGYHLQEILVNDSKLQIKDGDLFVVGQHVQVLNIVDFCNECGACTTFCPTSGAPWRDKPRVCLGDEAFALESTAYKFEMRDGVPTLIARENGRLETLSLQEDGWHYENDFCVTDFARRNFEIKNIEMKTADVQKVSFHKAAEMSVLLEALAKAPWTKMAK